MSLRQYIQYLDADDMLFHAMYENTYAIYGQAYNYDMYFKLPTGNKI